ncbi:MAG: biotin/lipoyl-binding protein [Ruminococcus sp.]|nr:biotin/lipoyl-binding protein [Ruminococcus sp.]
MKKFIITMLCLAIIAGGSYYGYLRFQKNKDEKRIVDVVSVSLVNQDYFSEEKTTDAYVTSGSIQNVELSTQNLVKQVCVKPGDKVKKGDILLVYDMTVVELENEKNKNQIAVIDQEIKEQEKELKRLQALQPKENAPKPDTSSAADTTSSPKTTTGRENTTTKYTIAPVRITTTTTKMFKPATSSTTVKTTTTTTTTTRRTTTKKPEPAAVSVRSTLTTIENPDGYELDGSILFRCSSSTLVTADFMQQIIDSRQHVILYVYDSEHKRKQYLWDIDPATNPQLAAVDWRADNGVISNHGSYAYNGAYELRQGVFYVYVEPEEPDYGGYDDYGVYDDNGNYDDLGGDDDDLGGDEIDIGGFDGDDDFDGDLPDITVTPTATTKETELPDDVLPDDVFPDDDSETDLRGDGHKEIDLTDDVDDGELGDSEIDIVDSGTDSADEFDSDSKTDNKTDKDKKDEPEDENYVYTRAELVEMVKEAQIALKEKQLEYRRAELSYKAGLKQKEDGVVTAQIDGVVTRVDEETTTYGVASGDYEFEEDMAFEDSGGIEESFDDGEWEDFEEDHPYITIQGKATVSLDINVPELSLFKFPKGTVVSGVDYNSGAEFTAVVTGRKDDPVSYRSYGDDNPNSSTYIVTADVRDCPMLAIDHYVTIKIPGEENRENRNALNIPVSYLRKDGASYYVMVADADGLLKKRYVKTGKMYYGSVIEVLGGLTLDDMICFPYGKDVKEGVKTRETDEVVW